MLKTLRNVPKESRVLAVVVVTLLVQVLVLSLFGLAALRGQEAEGEQNLREISRRVLKTNLVDEMVGRVEEAERRAVASLSGLPVEVPGLDPALSSRVTLLMDREEMFRRAFIIGPAGAWHDEGRRVLWPAPGRARAGGGDTANPFEAIEAEIAAGADPGDALERVRETAARQSETFQPAGQRLIARLALAAGRPGEAFAAWDRICRDYPTALDAASWPAVPYAPQAARLRAAARLDRYRDGEATAVALIADLVALRELISVNRFQMEEAYLDWEERRFEKLMAAAGEVLGVRDKVVLAKAIREQRESEDALLAARREFGPVLARAAQGMEPGGRLVATPSTGPLACFLVPLSGPAGPAGVVAFQLDIDRLRLAILPGILTGLPLPDGVSATVRTVDGKPVAGPTPPEDSILDQARLGAVLPFWQAVVFLRDPAILSRRITKARRLHYGVMALSIFGMLAAAWFLLKTVRGELRLAKMKSDFLSNVTHELKTPLTSIRMFVDMLEEGRATDESERREYLGVISRETERLSGLIQRVLDLARFEGRKGHALRPRPVDVAGFLTDTADVFRRRLTPAEAEVAVEVPEDLPDHAIDPEALREALLNLLSNALKYGGREIRLTASSENGLLSIEVADDGIGIAEHEQAKIFEKFYRAEDHLARDVEGSGLGLALVREVAKAHGGRVTVTSRVGEGSVFTLELPGTATGSN